MLPEMPGLQWEHYAPCIPEWFINLLRIVFLGLGVLMAKVVFENWQMMPLWVSILFCVLIPVIFLGVFHSRGLGFWSSNPLFLADHLGMYFSDSNRVVWAVGVKQPQNRWLFVPWENISKIWVATISDSEGYSKSAVIDVNASLEEVNQFFGYVIVGENKRKNRYEYVRADKQQCETGDVSVDFYSGPFPNQNKVVATLLDWKRRHTSHLSQIH